MWKLSGLVSHRSMTQFMTTCCTPSHFIRKQLWSIDFWSPRIFSTLSQPDILLFSMRSLPNFSNTELLQILVTCFTSTGLGLKEIIERPQSLIILQILWSSGLDHGQNMNTGHQSFPSSPRWLRKSNFFYVWPMLGSLPRSYWQRRLYFNLWLSYKEIREFSLSCMIWSIWSYRY